MAKNKKQGNKNASPKTWKKVPGGMAGLADAVKSTDNGNNGAEINEVATKIEEVPFDLEVAKENTEAGKEERAKVVSEDTGFKGKPNNPFSEPSKNRKGNTPRPPKKSKDEIEQAAKEIKAMADGKHDAEIAFAEEDKPEEVIMPESTDAQSVTADETIIADNGDNDPDDSNSPTAMVAGEEITQDDVITSEALIADEEVISEEAAKVETQEPQEEPVVTGETIENGGDEVKTEDEITGDTETDLDNVTPTATVISEEPVSETEVNTLPEITTESASDEPATVVNEESVVTTGPISDGVTIEESAAKIESEVVNETPEVSIPSEGNAATETTYGLSDDQKRKLDQTWLKKSLPIYKDHPRDEIIGMITEKYSLVPTDKIKNGDVANDAKRLPHTLYTENQKAAKIQKETAAKITTPVVSEGTPLSTDAPATSDVSNSNPEVTTEAAIETPAASLNGDGVDTAETVETAAKIDEAGEAIKPTTEEETVSIDLIEPVDTSKPEEMAAKVIGETSEVAPGALINEINDSNATAETVAESINNAGSTITDEEVEAAMKVDTAGTAIQDVVSETSDSASKDTGDKVDAGEVTNVTSADEIEPEVKTDAEATDSPGSKDETLDTATKVETDATVNQEVGPQEITPAEVITAEATINAPDSALASEANVDSAPINGSPVTSGESVEKPGKGKKPAQTLSHVGNITAFLQIANGAIESAYMQKNPEAKKYTQAKGKDFAEKWMKENSFDWNVKAVDYFEAAIAFCKAHNYVLAETTGKNFNKGDFIRTLETYKPVFGDWTLFNDLIAGAAVINNEHKASGREFICIGEPTTPEINKLRSMVIKLTAKVKELTEVSENLIKRADHWEGIATALADGSNQEADVITDPKALSFHERLVEEHKKTQRQESSSPRELSFLKKLVPKVVKSIRWQFSQQRVTRTLRKLAEQEHLTWMLEVTEELRLAGQTEKMERQLLAHRQMFCETVEPLPTVIRAFEGQYEIYYWEDEDGINYDDVATEQRVVNIRPLAPEEKVKLEMWREERQADGNSPNDRKYAYYSKNERMISNRRKDGSLILTAVNSCTQDITNPKPANKPVYNESAMLFDARFNKDMPIEQTTNDIKPTEEINHETLGLAPYRMYALKLSILEKLVRFSDVTKDEDSQYHILVTKLDPARESLFVEVLFRYVKVINETLNARIDPMLYLTSTMELARSIGTETFHCLDLFYQVDLPFSLASEIASELNTLAKCDAVVLRFNNSGSGDICVAVDLPETIGSMHLPKFVRDYKGSGRYLQKVAAHYAQPYLHGEAFGKVRYILVRKEYERVDYKGARSRSLAAHLNVYHIEELRGVFLVPDSIENAESDTLGIINTDMLLIKPTTVIELGPGQLAA